MTNIDHTKGIVTNTTRRRRMPLLGMIPPAQNSYSSSSDSDKGERANLCFMALGDDTQQDIAHDSDNDEVSKEELLVAHHTLFENFTKLLMLIKSSRRIMRL